MTSTIAGFAFWVVLFAANLGWAANYASPLPCDLKAASIVVQNSSTEARPFWFQEIGSNPFSEKYHKVPAKKTMQFALSDDYTSKTSAFAIKALHEDLKFQFVCKTRPLTWPLKDHSSAWKKVKLSAESQQLTLHLVNLAQAENTVEIQIGEDPGLTKKITLPKELASTSVSLDIPANSESLRLRGLGRMSAVAISASNQILEIEDEVQSLESVPYRRYFLFQSSYNNESFVAGFDNEQLIKETKEQVADPSKARILIAKIEKSIAGGNRDLQNVTMNSWSWRVSEAVTYTDFAHISCDGSPSVVEERLDDWIKNTGGSICFWGYRVQREVSFVELMQSPLWWRPGRHSLLHKR